MAYFYRFEYDVILVFSASDRHVAEDVARQLVARNIKLSLAEFMDGDAAAHLADVFGRKARFYILLLSQSFPLKQWKDVEQIASQVDADTSNGASILPVRIDDTEMSGLETASETKDQSTQNIIDRVVDTIVREKNHPGPPAQSHDLRSGNVPSTKDRDEM
jgi:hypothetical protein